MWGNDFHNQRAFRRPKRGVFYLKQVFLRNEQLIKIAGIVGRILQAEMKGVNDEGILTDIESNQATAP